MGEVYRAEDPRLGRDVAIKVLPASVAGDAERLRRFEQEARAASALNHPGILTVFDVGEDRGIRFLVTELLEGETLRARLDRGPMPRRAALSLAIDLARALTAAHAQGIVHRDLKPSNLFLTRDQRIKILDFGLARRTTGPASAPHLGEATTTADLTDAGAVLGTVGYMAPEQARGQAIDARADLFALGCVLYEMLVGRRAFDRGTAADTVSAILHDDPLDSPEAIQSLPDDLSRVVRHCLEKDPARRFHSAGDIAFALESLQEAVPPGPRPSSPEQGTGRRHYRLWGAGLVVVAATAAWAVLPGWFTASPSAPALRSIAVLPFVNSRGADDLEYLSDGITESLINKLSPLAGLKVLARSTVFQYKGGDIDPIAVGRTLGVDTVVSGRVDERDGRLTIGAELIEVGSGAQLWGDRFDRPEADVFDVEEQVARQIAERLAVRLGREEESRLAGQPTQDSEAYRLYMQGRYAWYLRTYEGVRRSLQLFQQAVAIDPGFALAWTGVADAYTVGWASYVDLPAAEAYTRGRTAALRALEIDPNLAEAHKSLGVILWEYDWDWAGAEREMRRAIELNPGYASAHQVYGELLYAMGRFDESFAEVRRAIELDPGAAILRSVLGWALLAQGDAEQAVSEFDAILKAQPGFIDSAIGMALATWAAGRPAHEVVDAALVQDVALGLEAAEADALRAVFDRDGLDGFWRARLAAQLDPAASGEFTGPLYVQWTWAVLGEADRAMDLLETMYEDHDPSLTYLKTGTSFAPLRGNPRFEALVARMEFPDSGS